ncbi:substance-K receptor-like isoform X2 [Ptychodera flava]|uniref:substance-K receptor-like isoform X2 n=1 Tax=Ptychodera flava TaxID=63121 RepID=UPI003969FD42
MDNVFLYVRTTLLILGVCYFRAAFKLGRRKLPGSSNQTRDKQQLRVKRKAMATLISAVILFAICWLPVHVYNLFFLTYNPQYLQSRPKITMTARACVFVWMVIVDAVINPVIYVFISDRFKRDICRLSFTCRRAVKRFRVKSSGKETTSCKTTMSDLRTTSQQRSSAMLQTYKKCLSKDSSDKMALKSML